MDAREPSDAIPPGRKEYGTHFRFLETADEHFPYSPDEVPPQGRWAISGLGLARPVLEAVYAGNAQRLIPPPTVIRVASTREHAPPIHRFRMGSGISAP